MTEAVIRIATAADAYEIAVMSRCLIEIGLRGWTWHPDRVARAIQSRHTNVIVAESAGRRVGFGIMEFGETTGHLSLLAIKPTHQRCGLGQRMMTWLEEAALTAGMTTITLELRTNNFGARCFYRILGFSEANYIPGYYRGVETALRMTRDIRRTVPDRIS